MYEDLNGAMQKIMPLYFQQCGDIKVVLNWYRGGIVGEASSNKKND